MAKSRPSFGDQVSKGIRDTYSKSKVPAQPPESAEEKPVKPERREAKPKAQAPVQ